MVKNFSDNVRGIDIAIDFSHENEKEAAGWVIQPNLRNDNKELWAEVKWTESGIKKVGGREFRYTSSEFSLDYTDNETLMKFGPTLLGVGLTNRPAVKGMEPIIQLSEYKLEKELQVDEKDKLIEQLKSEIAALKSKLEGGADLAEKEKELMEKEGEVKELSEKNSALDKENKELKEEKMKVEKKNNFDLMLSEGKVVEAQRDAFMEGNFSEFTKNAMPVKFSQTGNPGKEDQKEFASAQEEIMSLAEKRSKEKGENIADSIDFVLSENKELSTKYNEETKVN